MIVDNNLVLSGAQSAAGVISGQVVTTAGTFVSTNVIDTGAAPSGGGQSANGQLRDVGKGEPLEVAIEVLIAPSAGTSVQFQLVDADDAAISTNVNVLVQTDAFPIATLTIGKQIPLHYDRADPYVPRRFVAVRYVNVGAIASASYFTAVVKSIADPQQTYTGGFAVL